MNIPAITRTLLIVGCVLAGAAARADGTGITVLSSRPDLVSGDDVLVAIGVAGPVTLNGTDVTADFSFGATGKRIGLIKGLNPGANVVKAGNESLVVTNHPISGPIFSGPHETPFYCMTGRFTLPASKETLGASLDTDCSVKTRIDY